MQEEYIGTVDISGRTLGSTCFNLAKKGFFKVFFLLAGFVFFSLSSFAFQQKDSIKHVEIKILLQEKPKQGINYDSLFHADKIIDAKVSDSIFSVSSSPKEKNDPKKSRSDSRVSPEQSSKLNQYKKQIDTEIAVIQQKVLSEKVRQSKSNAAGNSIKKTLVEDRITFIQIGFLIFILGLFFGLRLNKVAFSISALGAILIVVALFI